MATGLVISRAFVRSDIFLEGYTWDGMGSLLEFAGAEAGGTPIVLVQQYGLFNLGSDWAFYGLTQIRRLFIITAEKGSTRDIKLVP